MSNNHIICAQTDTAFSQVVGNGIPVQGGAGMALRNMLLSYVKGRWRPGMQLPNFARCNRAHLPNPEKQYGTSTDDQKVLTTWLTHMMRFDKNSHLRGTCLLTGQQSTVDMTSNYKTSMTPFSSVNVVFMISLVMWITASFALFYIGGMPKGPEAHSNTGANFWSSDDFFMGVGIVWNLAAIIYMIVPESQVR
jgi:hypothetical protein